MGQQLKFRRGNQTLPYSVYPSGWSVQIETNKIQGPLVFLKKQEGSKTPTEDFIKVAKRVQGPLVVR